MKTLRVVGISLLYLAIYAGVLMLTSFALYNWVDHKPFQDWLAVNSGATMIFANIIVLAIYFPLLKWQRIGWKELGFVRPHSLTITAGSGIWLGLFIASFTQLPWIKEGFPAIANLVGFVTGGGGILVFLAGSLLLGSLLEEWLFRGMMLHVLRQRFSVMWSVVIQAVLFGAVFMNVAVGAFAALGAVIYGVIRLSSGSIWSSLMAHVLSTGTLYIVGKFSSEWSADMYLILAVISGLALLAHLYGMMRGGYEHASGLPKQRSAGKAGHI
ncbi:CPBP family intramembrane glutamic endopeptidase [Paenibacillus sp. GCM10027627]|uniref:CPBP family intramembrane glutamic endopeptidase n=1 Tax=unclassified Paenibacillus TaxID=185978 RepID=UPI003641E6E7